MAQSDYTTAVLADAPWVFYKLDESSGLPQDSSGNARHISTVDGTPTYHQAGPFSGSFSLLSTNSSQLNRSGPPNAVNNISVEFWLRLGQAPSANDVYFFNIGNATSGFALRYDTDGGFEADVRDAGGSTIMTKSTAVLTTTEFKHIVVVRDATVWKYYVNGALDTANAGTKAPADPSAQTLQFAQDFAATYSTYVSNAAYYNSSALSAARVLAHYNAGLAVAGGGSGGGIDRMMKGYG